MSDGFPTPPSRPDSIARLGAAPFDLLVIGGGIVGAGVARDAAMRGLSVALVERNEILHAGKVFADAVDHSVERLPRAEEGAR